MHFGGGLCLKLKVGIVGQWVIWKLFSLANNLSNGWKWRYKGVQLENQVSFLRTRMVEMKVGLRHITKDKGGFRTRHSHKIAKIEFLRLKI